MAEIRDEQLYNHLRRQFPTMTEGQIEVAVEEYRSVAHLILKLAREDVEKD